MADRLTAAQRKGQADQVSRNIEIAAEVIAEQSGCSMAEARGRVFQDRDLLDQCHGVAPIDSFPVEPV